jgi:hypothetical protein
MSESGRVKGKVNVRRFDEFVCHHSRENDWQKYVKKNRETIDKELICRECGFGKSAIIQNLTLKDRFENLIQELMKNGILKNQPSQEVKFGYVEQEIFIKTFDQKVADFNNSVDKLRRIIVSYSQEIDMLVQPISKDKPYEL